MPMFITKLKSPKVNIRIGRVITFKAGLIKKLIKPNIEPAKNSCWIVPVKSTPEISSTAAQRPKLPITIWTINRSIRLIIHLEYH